MSSPEDEALLLCAAGGHKAIITGQAGCGKTTVIKTIIEKISKTGRNVAVTASAAIAATQFSNDAMTVHRWSGVQVCSVFLLLYINKKSVIYICPQSRAHGFIHLH